ncbi:MAG: bifunctional oligoribonuclease/PAP phosphatase NrnA [Anaerolineaceae bacterium]|nr:bifunctional oligoribonuclease/PAP phosphatase NrnA [Anaerolineaceae bacterium]
MMNEAQILAVNTAIRQKLSKAQHILIVSHIRPDGDAIGSMLGLGQALIDFGKDVKMVLADGVPLALRYLPGSQMIDRALSSAQMDEIDLFIVVDCSDLQRTGGVFDGRIPDINIDHHITNPNFAEFNLVLPVQAATAAIIAEYLPAWGLSINEPIASALLTGIVTDTIGFRTSNMTPGILRLAAMLMEHGANLPELYTRSLINKSFEAARYWGMGLSKVKRVELSKIGSYVWTNLTLADRKEANYPGNDDADLVNLLSSIDSDLAVLFIEQKNDHIKVSWRARPGIDVSQIALQFGGGGHPSAAGADITGSLDMVQEQVLDSTRVVLTRSLQNKNIPA